MVIRDLGLCSRQHRQNRRLAHVGEAYQSDVRNGFQLQLHVENLRAHTRLGEVRRLAGGRCKVAVSPAAAAAVEHYARNTDLLNIRNDLTGIHVANQRAGRNLDDQVLAALAVGARRAAGLPRFGIKFAVEAEIQQRMHAEIGHKDDITALAAVAAVRAARLHELFAVEVYLSVAAVARF